MVEGSRVRPHWTTGFVVLAIVLGWIIPAHAYTPAQAVAGDQVYSNQCLRCHGTAGVGGNAPALRGAAFAERFPSVEETAGFVRTRMPGNSPGTLNYQEVYQVLSYLLAVRGVPADSQPLVPIVARGQTWTADLAFTTPTADLGRSPTPSTTSVTLQGEAAPSWLLPSSIGHAPDQTGEAAPLTPLLWGLGFAFASALAWRIFAT